MGCFLESTIIAFRIRLTADSPPVVLQGKGVLEEHLVPAIATIFAGMQAC